MRVLVQRVLESLGRAPQSRCDRPPRSHTRVTAHLTPTSISPPKRPDPCNNAMAASVIGLCKTVPIRDKGPWRDLGRPRVRDPRVRRLVQPPTTKTSKAQCLALPTTTIATTWNTTYLGAAIDHRLPTHQPPPSIRRHQHNTPPPGQLRPLTAAQTDAFCTDAGSTPCSSTRRSA